MPDWASVGEYLTKHGVEENGGTGERETLLIRASDSADGGFEAQVQGPCMDEPVEGWGSTVEEAVEDMWEELTRLIVRFEAEAEDEEEE